MMSETKVIYEKRVSKLYCYDFEALTDMVDMLLSEGYKIVVKYSDFIINNQQAYEITYVENTDN